MQFSFGRVLRATAMAGVAATALNSAAFAAGFQLKEQSATAQGNAFAGATAGADDISYMYFNPAALARHNGKHQTLLSLSYIAPDSELEEASATSTLPGPIGNVSGRSEQDDIGPNAVLPAFYSSFVINKDVVAGIGINTPLGLETDYSDNWVGRYEATDSEVLTINVNPAVAWQATPWLSVGGGVQLEYIDVELERAINFGAIGAALNSAGPLMGLFPGAIPHAQDGFARVEGDSFAAGYNLGFLVQPTDSVRVGVAYRSQIRHELEGDSHFDLGGPIGQAVAGTGAVGTFQDGGISASFNSPDTFSAGIHIDLDDQWAVMGEFQYTFWENFKELSIEYDDRNAVPGGNTTVREEWNNNRFFALGTTYRHDENLTLRGGIAFDETPVPDAFRTARIPDEDRYWASLGASYKVSDVLDFSASYTYIHVEDARISQGPDELGTNDNLQANYNSSINIFSVSGTYRF